MIQLRPSSAHIWTECAANPAMSARIPAMPESEPAMEGTCAAWVAEMVLTGQVATCADLIGAQHPENGWVVEPGMAQRIQKYVDLLRSYGGQVYAERRVTLNEMIAGTPDAFGVTIDDTLRVDDLKYGFDIVEPYRNPQISIYAAAILRQLPNIRRVVIGVYQPRAYHPAGIHRTWDVAPEDLLRYVEWIEARGVEAQNPAALATPGSHCEYCPAAATCGALAGANYRVYHRMFAAQQRNMSPEEMAEELEFLDKADDMLKGRKRAVEAEAEARISAGKRIPGWTRQSGKGQRRWKYNASTVKALTGLDPQSGKMVTPAELERQGASVDVLDLLTETPDTKAKLRPVPHNHYKNLFGGQ